MGLGFAFPVRPDTIRLPGPPLHRGVPAVLETRFVAANTMLSLPSMFNRQDRGRKLLDEVRSSPLLAQSPASFQAVVARRVAQQAAAQGN